MKLVLGVTGTSRKMLPNLHPEPGGTVRRRDCAAASVTAQVKFNNIPSRSADLWVPSTPRTRTTTHPVQVEFMTTPTPSTSGTNGRSPFAQRDNDPGAGPVLQSTTLARYDTKLRSIKMKGSLLLPPPPLSHPPPPPPPSPNTKPPAPLWV